MKVYLCVARRISELASRLTNVLEDRGYTVYNPCRDTNQDNFYEENINAINNADVVIAVIDYTGRDFCFEIGYAKGLNKTILTFALVKPSFTDRSMLNNILDPVNTLAGLIHTLHKLKGKF